MAKRGRPPGGKTQRQIRLPDDVWEALTRIAEREGLLYGGFPSRAEAVEWLVARDAERHAPGPGRSGTGGV